MSTPVDIWVTAQLTRSMTLDWLHTIKVELDSNPAANIGGLHAKAAEIREKSNKVRDAVYQAISINMALRHEAAEASWNYEQARAAAAKNPANEATLAKFKTKDEREAAVQQLVTTEYKRHVDAQSHLEEWDQYLKMVNLVYYSLSHTREDLNTQVSIVKQQMFNGEIKPNAALGQLSSLADLLGAEAKSLFNAPVETSGVPGGEKEVEWTA